MIGETYATLYLRRNVNALDDESSHLDGTSLLFNISKGTVVINVVSANITVVVSQDTGVAHVRGSSGEVMLTLLLVCCSDAKDHHRGNFTSVMPSFACPEETEEALIRDPAEDTKSCGFMKVFRKSSGRCAPTKYFHAGILGELIVHGSSNRTACRHKEV